MLSQLQSESFPGRAGPLNVFFLSTFVELLISKTEPGFKGDTATGGSKTAELETGLVVNVPLFVNEGDLLKIDTRTGEYVERVKSVS